jgi:hypothetical protein
MTFLEFFKCADIHDEVQRIVDLRPFGERQDEALHFYLHDIIEATMKHGGFVTDRRIVFRWYGKANLTGGTMNLLRNLQNQGAPIDLDPGAKRHTEIMQLVPGGQPTVPEK